MAARATRSHRGYKVVEGIEPLPPLADLPSANPSRSKKRRTSKSPAPTRRRRASTSRDTSKAAASRSRTSSRRQSRSRTPTKSRRRATKAEAVSTDSTASSVSAVDVATEIVHKASQQVSELAKAVSQRASKQVKAVTSAVKSATSASSSRRTSRAATPTRQSPSRKSLTNRLSRGISLADASRAVKSAGKQITQTVESVVESVKSMSPVKALQGKKVGKQTKAPRKTRSKVSSSTSASDAIVSIQDAVSSVTSAVQSAVSDSAAKIQSNHGVDSITVPAIYSPVELTSSLLAYALVLTATHILTFIAFSGTATPYYNELISYLPYISYDIQSFHAHSVIYWTVIPLYFIAGLTLRVHARHIGWSSNVADEWSRHVSRLLYTISQALFFSYAIITGNSTTSAVINTFLLHDFSFNLQELVLNTGRVITFPAVLSLYIQLFVEAWLLVTPISPTSTFTNATTVSTSSISLHIQLTIVAVLVFHTITEGIKSASHTVGFLKNPLYALYMITTILITPVIGFIIISHLLPLPPVMQQDELSFAHNALISTMLIVNSFLSIFDYFSIAVETLDQ